MNSRHDVQFVESINPHGVNVVMPSGVDVAVNKPKGWDIPTKNTIKRALDQSSKFVPNLKFEGFSEHPKTGESFGVVEISGKRYALLAL